MLNVELFSQPKDSVECGIAGLYMILKYYGEEINYDELKAQLPTDTVGTYVPQLCSVALKMGYKAKIITRHPGLFNTSITADTNLLKHFKGLYEKSKKDQEKKVLNHYIKFLEDGGEIDVKIPTISDLNKYLNDDIPIGALMTTNFLDDLRIRFNFHFNLVVGCSNTSVYTLDPNFDRTGGKKEHSHEEFLYAVHSNTYGDLDNGSFFIIEKK